MQTRRFLFLESDRIKLDKQYLFEKQKKELNIMSSVKWIKQTVYMNTIFSDQIYQIIIFGICGRLPLCCDFGNMLV